jgi:hypothetical protein
MKSEERTASVPPTSAVSERVFTVESANRALVLVRRIVQDIVARYADLMQHRAEGEQLAISRGAEERLETIRHRIDDAIVNLNRLHEELTDIGCQLKDWTTGLIDFPAMHEGRRVWLCWRLGETAITQWHEFQAGFAGRQPIGREFN